MKNKNDDIELDSLLNLHGQPESDEIVVNEFTENSAQAFRNSVLEAAEKDPQEPIVVYIDSYGGYADSLAKMIETMDEVPNPFITVAIGKAMSCGAILLSHGDMRFVGRHARVMIHEISAGTGGDVHDIGADSNEFKRQNKHFLGLLAENCNIKGGYAALRRMIKDQDGRNTYLDAAAAVKFGIADFVGMPLINRIISYEIGVVPTKVRLKNLVK